MMKPQLKYTFKLLFLAVLAMCYGVIAAVTEPSEEPQFKFFEPATTARKIDVKVSGKVRPYFLLEPGIKIDVPIHGIAKLKLVSRIVLAGDADTTTYEYFVERKGGGKSTTIEHTTHLSDRASALSEVGGGIGESRSEVLDVPKGDQSFTLSLPAGSMHKILFRFAENATEWGRATSAIAMTPSDFTSQIDLITKEETSSYYRIGASDRVVLSLVGPASLKVLSRIEFDPSMSAKQKWKIAVLEDGVEKGRYSLSAGKSEQTSYKQQSSFIPSAAQSFYVEIPAGPHRYEFTLPDGQRTALMRFLMPKSQLDRD